MKKSLLIIGALLILSGCTRAGRTTGYIYAIDQSFSTYTNNIWIKSDLESSESDCYRIENELVNDAVTAMEKKTRMNFQYDRELWAWAGCSEELITVLQAE